MVTIRAIRDSYGFRGQYWETGRTTEIAEGEKVPAHFERVNGKKAKALEESADDAPADASQKASAPLPLRKNGRGT